MQLPWKTQLRIKITKTIAWLMNIPIEVRDYDLYEYKVTQIDDYVTACNELFGPIFDEEKRGEFNIWVYRLLYEDVNNEYNLYCHPVEMVAMFLGIDHDDAKMEELYKKYNALYYKEQA